MNDKNKKNEQNDVDLEQAFNHWVLLEQTAFAVARIRDLELKHYGLTPAQASVLYTLEKNNGKATQNEISKFTMRQHHSVSTLINRMIDQGLVKKIQVANSRKSLVGITKKGRNTYASTSKSSVDMIFSVLSDEEKEIYTSLLTKMLKKAKNLLGIDFKPPFLPPED